MSHIFPCHRLLVAEDNSLNWEVLHELLTDLGLELEWAENGQICAEMFEKAEEGYYDAVLMMSHIFPCFTRYADISLAAVIIHRH